MIWEREKSKAQSFEKMFSFLILLSSQTPWQFYLLEWQAFKIMGCCFVNKAETLRENSDFRDKMESVSLSGTVRKTWEKILQ